MAVAPAGRTRALLWPSQAGQWSGAALCAVAIVALLAIVGTAHPIQDNNEGLYARVAQEMLQEGDWVIPRLDGVPYLEKPPLLYWLTALSFKAFGDGECAARAVPIVGSLLAAAAVFFFGYRRWDRGTALVAAAVLASSPLWLGVGRMLMCESLLAAFLAWSMVALFEGMESARFKGWIRLSYGALALAALTKGLLAIALYGLVAAVMLCLAPDWRRRAARLVEPAAIVIFMAIAVPWHVMAARREAGFAWFYLVNEHILRYLDLREPRDYYHGAWWYYLPRMLLASFPWTLALLVRSRAPRRISSADTFAAAAFIVPLVFFSLSSAKANYYMAVAMPFLSLWLAGRIRSAEGNPRLAAMPAALLIAVAAGAMFAPGIASLVHASPIVMPLFGVALVLLASAIAFMLNERTLAGIFATAASSIPLVMLASAWVDTHDESLSARRLAAAMKSERFGQAFLYRDFESLSSLAYYLRAPVGIIDSASNDLAYGIGLRRIPERFPSATEFVDQHVQPAAIVVRDAHATALLASPLAPGLELMRVIGSNRLYRWSPSTKHK
jgi:4-amino-4-deoxy-L-arabinose transferase-like glycosyltransferase